MLLAGLFGSETAERVLLYMANYGEGYAKGIADLFGIPVSQVQKQLLKFEREGVLVSQLKGRTRVYMWNPRYMFRIELQGLLNRALASLPADISDKYFKLRTRPRRAGKPL